MITAEHFQLLMRFELAAVFLFAVLCAAAAAGLRVFAALEHPRCSSTKPRGV
jgi:hypothetical protein